MLKSAPPVRYETTRKRVAAAFVVGAIVGASELDGFHCALGVACDQRSFLNDLGFGFVFMALGIAVVSPAWWALHRRNHRAAFAAVSLGVASALVPMLLYFAPIAGVLIGNGLYPDGFELVDNLVRLALFLLVGGSVGWAVWRTAYRTATDKAPALSA